MTVAMSLASGVTLPSMATTFATLTTRPATRPKQRGHLAEDRAELAQVDGVVAVIGRVAGERVLRVIRSRHVRRRGQHEIHRLVHQPRQLAGITEDQLRRAAGSTSSDLQVLSEELDADGPPSHSLRDGHGRAVAGERVEDEISRLAGIADDGRRQRLGEVDVVRGALGSLGHEVSGAQQQRLGHLYGSASGSTG